jgi:hypothetical protein
MPLHELQGAALALTLASARRRLGSRTHYEKLLSTAASHRYRNSSSSMKTTGPTVALVVVVLIHLALNVLHVISHVRAAVALGRLATTYVIIVIGIGPLAGLAYARIRRIVGSVIVGASMAGAFVFGLVNHFLMRGADQVSNVPLSWRPLFESTAVLLLVTEFAGVAIATWYGSRALSSRTL